MAKIETLATIAAYGKYGENAGTYKITYHRDNSINPFHVSFHWVARDGIMLSGGYIMNAKHQKTIEKYADYKSALCHVLQQIHM